ncbi:hypothetical protein CsSME_00035603 [Camellia sinensis var. sinensis]
MPLNKQEIGWSPKRLPSTPSSFLQTESPFELSNEPHYSPLNKHLERGVPRNYLADSEFQTQNAYGDNVDVAIAPSIALITFSQFVQKDNYLLKSIYLSIS